MPRKHFRKYLPSHATVRSNRVVALFGSALHHHNLWHLHRRSVAGGLAAGLFAGMIPGPLQMLTAAVLAILLRVNLPVAVLATWLTNPVTIVPIYLLAFKLGVLILGGNGESIPALPPGLGELGLGPWLLSLFAWFTTLGKPLVVGLLVLGLVLAAAGYAFVMLGWRLYVILAWRRRAAARSHRSPRGRRAP